MDQHVRTRTLSGLALIGGISAFVVGDLLRRLVEPPDYSTSWALTSAVHTHLGLWLVAGLLELLSALLLVPGAMGARWLAPVRGAALTTIGSVLMVIGAIASIGHTIGYYGVFAMFAESGLDAASVNQVAAANGLLDGVVIALFMLGLLVGPVLLTVGLRRAGAVPIWVPVLAVVFVVTANVNGVVAGLVGLAAALAAFGYIGFCIMGSAASAPARPVADHLFETEAVSGVIG